MDNVEVLRKKISEKIIFDSINGTKPIEDLPLNLAIFLLKIHTKRYVQYYSEYGYKFENHITDYHYWFEELFKTMSLIDGLSLSKSMLRNIEYNTIYSPNSIFLHGYDLVLDSDIKALLGLHDLGFLNFNPCHAEELNKYLKVEDEKIKIREFSDFYTRSAVGKFSILINTPNHVDIPTSFADKHFKKDSPQYARYVETIELVNSNAKAIKQVNDVFASMIFIDSSIININKKIRMAISGSVEAEKEFENMLSQFQIDISLINKNMKKSFFFMSDLNQILGFILNAPNLNKMNRMEVLEFIFNKENNVKTIGSFFLKHNLLNPVSIRISV